MHIGFIKVQCRPRPIVQLFTCYTQIHPAYLVQSIQSFTLEDWQEGLGGPPSLQQPRPEGLPPHQDGVLSWESVSCFKLASSDSAGEGPQTCYGEQGGACIAFHALVHGAEYVQDQKPPHVPQRCPTSHGTPNPCFPSGFRS